MEKRNKLTDDEKRSWYEEHFAEAEAAFQRDKAAQEEYLRFWEAEHLKL